MRRKHADGCGIDQGLVMPCQGLYAMVRLRASVGCAHLKFEGLVDYWDRIDGQNPVGARDHVKGAGKEQCGALQKVHLFYCQARASLFSRLFLLFEFLLPF